MQRISSGSTFISRRLFPIAFFGILLAVFVPTLLDGSAFEDLMLLIGPAAMAIFGYVMIRVFTGDLADEVQDFGDYLLVKHRGIEERISIANIMNVSSSTFVKPPRVTLRLVQPSKFGKEVSFSPKMGFSLNPLAKSPIVEQLIERAFAARSKSAG